MRAVSSDGPMSKQSVQHAMQRVVRQLKLRKAGADSHVAAQLRHPSYGGGG